MRHSKDLEFSSFGKAARNLSLAEDMREKRGVDPLTKRASAERTMQLVSRCLRCLGSPR